MISLINNQDQNRPGSNGFQPVISVVAPGTGGRRGVVLNHTDALLRITLELLRMTIELLNLLQMTLDQIRRDVPAAYVETCPQQL